MCPVCFVLELTVPFACVLSSLQQWYHHDPDRGCVKTLACTLPVAPVSCAVLDKGVGSGEVVAGTMAGSIRRGLFR